MKAISISHLTKTYANGTQALCGIDFDVDPGDFFALLGANGAGKTTIIGILTGLVQKTAGQVSVFGYDLDTQIDDVKRCIGVVPQEFNFNIFEKVQDIVITQAGYFGLPRKQAIENAEEILNRVGLWDKRDDISRTLSGGMKRRLMIARALVHKPQLLILDEPTAGVDVELRHGMWDYLRQINQSGTTILLTTHYLEEVEQMCQHAAMIKEGKILHHDRVQNLVQMLQEQTYVITVASMKSLDDLLEFQPNALDDQTIEVTIDQRFSLDDVLSIFIKQGFVITDCRPKGQRLEQLFLKFLKS